MKPSVLTELMALGSWLPILIQVHSFLVQQDQKMIYNQENSSLFGKWEEHRVCSEGPIYRFDSSKAIDRLQIPKLELYYH